MERNHTSYIKLLAEKSANRASHNKFRPFYLDLKKKAVISLHVDGNFHVMQESETDFESWMRNFVDSAVVREREDLVSVLRKFLNKSVHGECCSVSPFCTVHKSKGGSVVKVAAEAVRVKDSECDGAYFLCYEPVPGIPSSLNLEEDGALFYAATEERYVGILKISIPSFEVEKVKVQGGRAERIPVGKKWSQYLEDFVQSVNPNDRGRFLTYTLPEMFLSAAPGDSFKMNYRSTWFSSEDDEKWLFSFIRFFDGGAYMFTVDETAEVIKRKKIELVSTQQDNRYKMAIAADAIAIYEFNLTRDLLVGNPVQKFGGRMIQLRDAFGLREECSFTEFAEALSWDMSASEKTSFLQRMDVFYLTDCYIRGEYEVWFDQSRMTYDGDSFRTRTTIILTKDEETQDIMGLAVVKNITSFFHSEEEKIYQMEIISGLTKEYSNVYMINLLTSRIRVVRLNDSTGAFYSDLQGDQRYEDALDFYVAVSVFEDDRDMIRTAFSKENILRQLSERESFYANFRSCINGKISYMKLNVVRIGEPREYSNVLFAFTNVDEEIEHEMKQKKLLQDALSQAESANRAKSLFLSNMSHDIRTPMNAIVGFTNIAMDHLEEPGSMKNYLDKIKTSSRHLLGLINDVLDMSKIESGKMKIQCEIVTIEEIISDTETVIRPQAEEKNQSFTVECSSNVRKKILCDRLRLNQILINLLGNAVKYTPEKGSIVFSISEKDAQFESCSSYRFCVKDNGIGMSEKFKERLFEAFERDDRNETHKIQGTGLGLAITKNLIDLMGGEISVDTEMGKGSTFTVDFNFENAGKSELDEGNGNAGLPYAKQKKEFTPKDAEGVRLLLVEDNELNRDIAREILKSVGYTIDEATNGKLGVEMIAEHEAGYYSLVLMDMQMPVMNGCDATRAIRQLDDPVKSSVPVMAMTANAFEDDKRAALSSGMNDYIAKPFDTKELLEKIVALTVRS